MWPEASGCTFCSSICLREITLGVEAVGNESLPSRTLCCEAGEKTGRLTVVSGCNRCQRAVPLSGILLLTSQGVGFLASEMEEGVKETGEGSPGGVEIRRHERL